MKTSTKIYYSVLAIVLLSFAVTYFIVTTMGWSRIETKLTSQCTIKSTINKLDSRLYTLERKVR